MTDMGIPRVAAFHAWDDLAGLDATLDALNRSSRRPCPFAAPSYLRTFWTHDEHLRPGDRLLFLVAFEAERPVGYLPLRRRRERILGFDRTRIGLLAEHDSDRPHVVAAPADELRCSEAFYRHLVERERDWTALELACQDPESALDRIPALPRTRYYARRFPTMPNSTLQLPFRSTREYVASLGRAHRKGVTKNVRDTLEAGRVEAVWSGAPAARAPLLELYLDLESRSWKPVAGAGIGRDPRRVAFFRELCAPGHPLGVHFTFVLLDDVPIASLLCCAFDGIDHAMETTFDEGFRELSPGNTLLFVAVESALRRGARAINFDGNYAYYKSRWGASVSETHAVQVYRVPSLHWLKARAGELKRWALPHRLLPQTSNPERLEASRQLREGASPAGPGKPARDPVRRRTLQTLAALESAGVEVHRMAATTIAEALTPRQPRHPAARRRGTPTEA